VARPLVVEREPGADVPISTMPRARRARRAAPARAARRAAARGTREQWLAAEHVLEVGEDQLLVLLLVVEAELEPGERVASSAPAASARCTRSSIASR